MKSIQRKFGSVELQRSAMLGVSREASLVNHPKQLTPSLPFIRRSCCECVLRLKSDFQ